jgi:hypothetical protein
VYNCFLRPGIGRRTNPLLLDLTPDGRIVDLRERLSMVLPFKDPTRPHVSSTLLIRNTPETNIWRSLPAYPLRYGGSAVVRRYETHGNLTM